MAWRARASDLERRVEEKVEILEMARWLERSVLRRGNRELRGSSCGPIFKELVGMLSVISSGFSLPGLAKSKVRNMPRFLTLE